MHINHTMSLIILCFLVEMLKTKSISYLNNARSYSNVLGSNWGCDATICTRLSWYPYGSSSIAKSYSPKRSNRSDGGTLRGEEAKKIKCRVNNLPSLNEYHLSPLTCQHNEQLWSPSSRLIRQHHTCVGTLKFSTVSAISAMASVRMPLSYHRQSLVQGTCVYHKLPIPIMLN